MTLDDFISEWVLWLSFAVAVVAVAIFVALKVWPKKGALAIQRKSRMLSAAEKNFFECLSSALVEDFYIFTKVRIMDVVEPLPAASKAETRFLERSLSLEHLDYVLCNKRDLSIFGVVELENFEKRNNAKEKALREKLVSDVCKTANLKLFYFDVRQDYQGVDIRRLVTGKSRRVQEASSEISERSQMTVDSASVADYTKTKSCPKCYSEVVVKVAVKGARIGEKFMMCRKYPYCDYQVALKDSKLSKMKKNNEQNGRSTKVGYNDWTG